MDKNEKEHLLIVNDGPYGSERLCNPLWTALNLIKRDLSEGNIERLINNRLKHYQEGGATICPVCHAEIHDPTDGAFTLFFGPRGLRKKASFLE